MKAMEDSDTLNVKQHCVCLLVSSDKRNPCLRHLYFSDSLQFTAMDLIKKTRAIRAVSLMINTAFHKICLSA